MVYNHDFEKVKDTIPSNITTIFNYWRTDFGDLKHYYHFLETLSNLPKNTTNSLLIPWWKPLVFCGFWNNWI
jgi:hypothetical protein